ncbi:MAG: Holliday junction resolvase RuvX [Acidobacteria bacterium]|nr:Holliday junction resolvase RuvX [Acidobacteriota bacterium]MDA1236965.1 Holliday junction resolvase RuvX [Acidobacteriota bacterium]
MLAGCRTLALDWGKARIGLAITDESDVYVQTLPTLRRKNRAVDLGELSRIIEDNSVSTLVVGAPLHMDGRVSPSSSQAEQLGRTLAKRCGIELVLWDERLTSVAAEEILAERGGKRKPGDVDRVAAALILQSYLENRPAQASGGPC